MTVFAKLKSLHSPDIDDLESFVPAITDEFGFLLQLMIGPADSDGKESFDVVICTTKWLDRAYASEYMTLLTHHVLVSRYDFVELRNALSRLVAKLSAESWKELSLKLSRLGRWEYEDYTE